tara:strand:- start:709 stop:2133 length:1425 start_codon:yes stop_codon:yes gene_type:complete
MVDYSDNLKIELIGDGEQAGSWGNTTNDNWKMIEAAVSAKQTVNITTDKTSSSPQDIALANGSITNAGGRAFVELTDDGDKGATQHFRLTPESAERIIYLKNSLTTQAAKIFQTTSFDDSKDVQIENGETAILYFDGGGASSATVTKLVSDPIFTTVQSSGAATLNSATVTNNLTVSGNIVVTGNVDGRDVSADGAKLDGIEAGAQANQSTAQIFTAIKGVDGTGSGLDADLLDGQQGSYYQPASTAITTSNISSQSVASATTAATATSATSATNATQLGGEAATSYARSDAADVISGVFTFSASPKLNDSVELQLGTGADAQLFHNGSHLYLDIDTGDFYIRSGSTTKYLFDRSAGDFHADGDVIAASTSVGSDRNLKDNIQNIEDPLGILSQINGVTFDWKRDGSSSAGVIAQDVAEAGFGSAVKTQKNLDTGSEYLTVDYNQIVGLLVASVKELKEEVSQLKKELENGSSE